MKINISGIILGERHRKDMGDLAELAASIRTEGLLQPVGVTSENELVFGERRLLACRDHLGWTEIDVRVVNVTGIFAGQYAENEIRKDFTLTERVALKKALEKEYEKRQGQRRSQPHEKFREVENTRPDLQRAVFITARSGLGNTTYAREAELVVDKGIPQLTEAMDRGDINIELAGIIAREPRAEQAKIIALPKRERSRRLSELRTQQRARRAGARQAKAAQMKRPKTITRPYLALEVATDEETERPPPGSSLQEVLAWRDKIGAKVPLWSMNAKQLFDCKGNVEQAELSILNLAGKLVCDAEVFYQSTARMLAHRPKPESKSGDQIDFAKTARRALSTIARDLDKAIEKLLAYREGLARQRAS